MMAPTTSKGRARPIPFDQFATAILESYGDRPYATRYAVSRTLEILEVMGVKTTAELERDDIEERFAAECRRRGWLESTVDTWVGRLRARIRRGFKLGLLRREPEMSVSKDCRKEPRTTVGAPQEKMERLVAHAAGRIETWEGERIYALVVTIAGTGIPLVAAINLTPADVDLERGTLNVWVGRGKRFEETPISNAVARVIDRWLPRANEFLFPRTPAGGKWHLSGRIAGEGPHPALEALCRAAAVGHTTFARIRGYYFKNPFNAAALAAVPAADVPKRCVVELTQPGGPVRVYGRLKRKLSSEQFSIVNLLHEAGPVGIDPKQIAKAAKEERVGTGWWQTLDFLRKSDTDWARALRFPGRARGGCHGLMWEAF
jgi:integrase